MAANLTEQVRGIVKVVTAVAEGDLKRNLTVQAKGEVAALAETINDRPPADPGISRTREFCAACSRLTGRGCRRWSVCALSRR